MTPPVAVRLLRMRSICVQSWVYLFHPYSKRKVNLCFILFSVYLNKRRLYNCHNIIAKDGSPESSGNPGLYLQRGEYPSGLDKGEKANFRRKCKNNFKFEDEVLYYRKHSSKAEADQDWRVCVRRLEDKARIIESCHNGPTGGHFGRNKTSNTKQKTHT